MNEPRTYPEGVTCWVEFEEGDVEAAARFYGVLFGWTFIDTAPESKVRHLIAQLDGQDAAGIGQPPVTNDSAARAATWNTYIAVRDIDQAVARVEAAGGRITGAPSNPDEAGRTASCVDTGGVPFRLWQAGRRLGAQSGQYPRRLELQ